MGLAVAFLRPVAQSVGRLGIDPNEFLRAVGVDDCIDDDHFVSTARVENALAQFGRRIADPAFGLSLARASPMGSLGTFDYAVWSSPTLGDALKRSSRIYAFICRGVSLDVGEDEGVAHVGVRGPAGAPAAVVLSDFTLAIHLCRMRETLGEVGAVHPSLRHAEASPGAYEAFFGELPCFGAPRDALSFDAALLSQRLRTAAPQTATVLEAHALAAMPKLHPVDAFLDEVRAVVARRLRDGDVTLHVVAQDLGKSSRSLQRQLGARRTSHRELVDEVRREIALARLGDSEESIVAVAHDLGFTTPQSFYRAFSRWTGMTPLAFRAARRSET